MRSVSLLEALPVGISVPESECTAPLDSRRGFRDSPRLWLLASNDFVAVSLMSHHSSLTAPMQFVHEAIILGSLGIWITYCALPQTVRKPVMMPVSSTIFRWNEIASALGPHRDTDCRGAAAG